MSADAYLAHYVDTKRLCRDVFPDLFFGEPGFADHISIVGWKKPVRHLRIRQPQARPLHLRRIEIMVERDGTLVNIAPDASLEVSSLWPHSDWLVKRKVFLTSSGERYGFHTALEENAWVAIDLGAPEQIACVRIYNRTDEFAYRARGIVVESSQDNANWNEDYSYAAREAVFRSVLEGRRRHAPDGGPSEEGMRILDQVLFHHHSHGEIREFFARLRLGPDMRRAIFPVVNAQELFRRELELTNHGVKRTFRFWSAEQKAAYIAQASYLIAALRAQGHEACLGYGGVLAVVREQDLIPHDDDIDVIVSAPRAAFATLADFMARTGAELASQGFRVAGNFVSHRHARLPDWPAPVDVFFGFHETDSAAWYPGPRYGLRRDDVFPPIACTFFGVEILIPRNPFRYLEHVYGASWARPQPGWNHSWIEAEYADWFAAPAG
jgi:hypothetical protein